MATKLRAVTNLVVPKHLQLPKAELGTKFLGIYSGKAYTGLEPAFMHKLWLSSMFPEIANNPTFGKTRKKIREFMADDHAKLPAGLLKLKKVNSQEDPHFIVAVPLAGFNRWDAPAYLRMLNLSFTDGKTPIPDDKASAISEELQRSNDIKEVQERHIPPQQVISAMHLEQKAALALHDCLLGVRLQYSGGLAVIFADFKITKGEAQQLTTTEWMMIRNSDLYPLLLSWQVSGWGFTGKAPLMSFPMSKISATLPPVHEGQARVSEYGLAVTQNGAPVWLPEKLDNTKRYEDLYSQVGDQGDDTFGLVNMFEAGEAAETEAELKVKLPANIPVLIDWVNNRYAYTNSNGHLTILDISRYKAMDHSHALNRLEGWALDKDDFKVFVGMGTLAGVPEQFFFTKEEMEKINEEDAITANALAAIPVLDFKKYFDAAYDFHQRIINDEHKAIPYKFVSIEGPEIWRPMARYVDLVQAAVMANMEKVNTTYSVWGVTQRLGQLTLIAKYGNDKTNTELKANTIRSAATAAKKGPDPSWRLPSVPMIMDNPERPFSLLPHQDKVRNLLRDSPDFALLPVQAGGGKTPLIIVDILLEIKANRSQPYLIMCPPSLVAQYVKEITYFTDGKINVIPIATDTIFRNGFTRLTKMIETAPRNTIVVVNYDVLRAKSYDVCYGTENVTIYPVIEFLRQFNFGYAALDESHSIKNDSSRTRAALQLINEIPKKRLASGTMAHDSPSDLALQVATLDPTLFGSRDEFNKRFGQVVKGGKVIEWKLGAQTKIMNMIKSRIVVAGAMRKEWAALLPRTVEKVHMVELTEAQRAVYDSILEKAIDAIREAAKTNPSLRKFFEGSSAAMLEGPTSGGKSRNEEEDEEEEDAADESAGEDLEALLGFHLARVEQFLVAPAKDELGNAVLKGEDRISPKAKEIHKIIQQHVASGIPGKVLIFTNYIEAAEEIFYSAPPELQKSGILYTAANKEQDGAAFEKDASKTWMVGVEFSMNTGLNFQHVSRLIRSSNPWNPGTLEQGNARLNRPEMKKADRRAEIYFDWLVVDKSMDVAKNARLISKMIAVGKFENADVPEYETVPEVPLIKMNLDAIMTKNTQSALLPYMQAFQQFNQVKADDYKKYREKHGDLTLTPILEADAPKDAALMAQVPYIPGLELLGQSKLGLIRVDEYLRMSAADMAKEDEDEGEDEGAEGEDGKNLSEEQRKRLQLAESLKGQLVHTEFGDGTVKSVAFKGKRVNVFMPEGYMIRVKFGSAFVMTKGALKKMSMREAVLKSKDNKMPIAAPLDIASPIRRFNNAALRNAEKMKQKKEHEALKQQKKREAEALMNVELELSVSNGFLSISYFPKEGSDASKALEALGFRPVEPYVYAKVRTANLLIRQFNKWWDEGFRFDAQFEKTGAVQAIKDLAELLRGGKIGQGMMNYKFATKNQLANFFRMEVKPSASKNLIKPYPMIEDDAAYICMHPRGNPAALKAMQAKVSGVMWKHSVPCVAYYGLDLMHTLEKLKEIHAAGIQIANLQDLKEKFQHLKKQKFRNNEDLKAGSPEPKVAPKGKPAKEPVKQKPAPKKK